MPPVAWRGVTRRGGHCRPSRRGMRRRPDQAPVIRGGLTEQYLIGGEAVVRQGDDERQGRLGAVAILRQRRLPDNRWRSERCPMDRGGESGLGWPPNGEENGLGGWFTSEGWAVVPPGDFRWWGWLRWTTARTDSIGARMRKQQRAWAQRSSAEERSGEGGAQAATDVFIPQWWPKKGGGGGRSGVERRHVEEGKGGPADTDMGTASAGSAWCGFKPGEEVKRHPNWNQFKLIQMILKLFKLWLIQTWRFQAQIF
jgi:hypothetical protein